MRFVLLAAIALFSCADDPGGRDERPAITHACVRSFYAVSQAWEAASGKPVPIECSLLDLEYDVQVVDDDAVIPCVVDPSAGLLQVGCTRVDERVIYILGGRDDVTMVDTSVHEWLHALADCVLGDPDREHLRAGIWVMRNGAASAETQAMASAEIGECL